MILGAVLNPINSSMVAVALVPIGIAFGAPPAETAWLVSGLYLATAIGQPVVGRLVDTFGPRRLFLTGTALVGAAGVLGALSPQLWVLVLARVLLGFGTCAGYPAAMYLIRAEATRTGANSPAGILTLLSVATQTISVVGPTLGGLLIGLGGWRGVFAVNVPLAAVAFGLGARRLPRTPRTGPVPSLDHAGIALFAVTLVALLLFLMEPARWWLLPVAVAAGAGFARRELTAADPFLDLRVFGGNRPLPATYGRTLLTYVVSYAFLYGYTQWLEEGRGLSASVAGLMLLPMSVTAVAVSALTGRRAAVRGKLVVGALAQVVACAALLAFGAGTPLWMVVGLAIVIGIPQGVVSLANQNALYHQADPGRIGASAGLLRTFGYLGAIVASVGNGVFLADRADTPGLHHLALFLLVVAVVFLAVTLADRSLRSVAGKD
ncbi:MFS transporter [Pseudonocardia xishanensis]